MTTLNTKDKRIAKLFRRGLTIPQIARKIGMPLNIDRIIQGLAREGFIVSNDITVGIPYK